MSMIKKEFILYEEALKLKKLGFDELCFTSYDDKKKLRNPFDCTEDYNESVTYIEDTTCFVKNSELKLKHWVAAPTYSQVFRWFEENHSIYVQKEVTTNVNEILDITYTIKSWQFKPVEVIFDNVYDWTDRSKAELACLKKLIELVDVVV